MANNRCTYQQVTNVSINKEKLIEIASDDSLSELDLRVLLVLFTELNGWKEPASINDRTKDPENFTKVDIKTISDTLMYKKKKIKESIDRLRKVGLIESGTNDRVRDGWRFTF